MKKRLFSVMLRLLALIVVFTSSAQANEGIKSGLFTYTMKGNGTAVITAFDSQFNRNKDVYVPSQIDGYTVSEIGNSAFLNAESKSVIVLPDTLTTIGTAAFSWSKFTSISIPSGVKQIGAAAFSKMENVEKFSVDKGNAIYATIDGVLYNKISKELVAYPGGSEYSIPEGILSIGDSAFQSYKNGVQNEPLKVLLPNTLRTIGRRAFEGLELGNFVIPSSVEEIGEGAFRNANLFSFIDGEQILYLPRCSIFIVRLASKVVFHHTLAVFLGVSLLIVETPYFQLAAGFVVMVMDYINLERCHRAFLLSCVARLTVILL